MHNRRPNQNAERRPPLEPLEIVEHRLKQSIEVPWAPLLAPPRVAQFAVSVIHVPAACALPVVTMAVHPLAVSLVAVPVVPAPGAPEIPLPPQLLQGAAATAISAGAEEAVLGVHVRACGADPTVLWARRRRRP